VLRDVRLGPAATATPECSDFVAVSVMGKAMYDSDDCACAGGCNESDSFWLSRPETSERPSVSGSLNASRRVFACRVSEL